MALFAQWERRIISQRTRDALVTKKADGVHIGPATLSADREIVARSPQIVAAIEPRGQCGR
jgi:DNA invertase Pin-like site-specific DNA recombinase